MLQAMQRYHTLAIVTSTAPRALLAMQVLTDDGKIQTIESYARVDPISDYMLMSAPVKLGARWCYARPLRACLLNP